MSLRYRITANDEKVFNIILRDQQIKRKEIAAETGMNYDSVRKQIKRLYAIFGATSDFNLGWIVSKMKAEDKLRYKQT